MDAGGLRLGGDVPAGVEPLLVKDLRLEAAKNGLDGLSRRLVGSGGPVDGGYVLQPGLGVCPARAALVIRHELIRLAAGIFQRIAHGLVKGFKAFCVADVAAQEDLTGSVDDFVYIEGGKLVAAVDIGLIEKVQTGAVTVPQRIGHSGKDGGVLTGVQHLCLRIADDRALPLDLHLRTGQVVNQRHL